MYKIVTHLEDFTHNHTASEDAQGTLKDDWTCFGGV